jgi:hypothetical protein
LHYTAQVIHFTDGLRMFVCACIYRLTDTYIMRDTGVASKVV